ncbi:presqualene diphosphate synthase HpnD [Usitatibacter palustris]|uniref:15-cis-phytoene synthase n=1 Tax=Usitatibacter palustris TaxID=2732487 RepID=A0A6M4HB14_9PROT|nr:presqualene diphosphate synthase HpnD [Usitatibacter palustris]QJR15654.1 15-cis-phytoene synthase [Usitatibacter palustris]
MTPDEYCQEKAARSGSSFYYSFLFLPQERRRAITALYAFCREVDDVADEVHEVDVARAKLAWWRTEIANLYAGHPAHPVTQALAPFTKTFGIDSGRLNEIVDGMEMDLTHHRYADFEALKLYCHRVAGVVGQLSASIFGYRNASTLEYAESLGLAFQLTNIIRDVGEDARRGRVYLPVDELAKHGLTPEDILARRPSDGFRALMDAQAQRAESYYDRAFAHLAPEDRRDQRAGLIMASIYRTLLGEIRRDGFDVLDRRIALTPLRKLWLAWRTWVKS